MPCELLIIFPPSVRAVIPKLDGMTGGGGGVLGPKGGRVQLCIHHFTLVVTVGNVQENSIYTAFRPM